MLDLFSRKVVGWEVHEEENAEQASSVIHKARLGEGRGVLHADNGRPMKGATLRATLQKLGIAPSFSRPGVSDDKAHAEAFCRTLTYRPDYPSKGFKNFDEARDGSMQFVTPSQRHQGAEVAVLNARKTLYETAKAVKPERWSRSTRNGDRPDTVWLNPVRQKTKIVRVAA